MGGAVPMEKLHEFSWTLHLSELKFQLKSNVVPIGLIIKGIYCHRALLFKVPHMVFQICPNIQLLHFDLLSVPSFIDFCIFFV